MIYCCFTSIRLIDHPEQNRGKSFYSFWTEEGETWWGFVQQSSRKRDTDVKSSRKNQVLCNRKCSKVRQGELQGCGPTKRMSLQGRSCEVYQDKYDRLTLWEKTSKKIWLMFVETWWNEDWQLASSLIQFNTLINTWMDFLLNTAFKPHSRFKHQDKWNIY